MNYLILMEKKFFGLTRKDVENLAYRLAIANGLRNPFSDQTGSAGRKWLDLFLKRHKNTISVRKLTGTSIAMIRGFNKESVNQFFDLLEEEYSKHTYPADHIFNFDETGLSIVESKIPTVLALKGKHQVGSIISAERGSFVTLITCMSAG